MSFFMQLRKSRTFTSAPNLSKHSWGFQSRRQICYFTEQQTFFRHVCFVSDDQPDRDARDRVLVLHYPNDSPENQLYLVQGIGLAGKSLVSDPQWINGKYDANCHHEFRNWMILACFSRPHTDRQIDLCVAPWSLVSGIRNECHSWDDAVDERQTRHDTRKLSLTQYPAQD